MSGTVGIVLDSDCARVLVRRDGRDEVRDVAWTADAPEALVEALRAVVGSPSAIVVFVGLGFLEVAEPELPPLAPDARQAMLWRDADRYFPIAEPAAVVSVGTMALATGAKRLARWVAALRAIADVRAIVSTPQAYARVLGTGSTHLPAGPNELGLVQAERGEIRSVRRAPASVNSDAVVRGARAITPVEAADVLRSASSWIDAPLVEQLLDPAMALTVRRDRRRQWAGATILVGAAVGLLLAAVNHARGAQLTSLRRRALELETRAEPAALAAARRDRAEAELTMLAEANARAQAADSPLGVLAQLTRVLPRDAFVQRLEYDGQQWRVDGTADNAPRLVPLLDGDRHFRDVRIAAPTQRFIDVGRQRESFAMFFQLNAAQGATRGTP